MRVSVALASYNGSAHIEQQLRSILEQSHPPDEIVVSDDASSDSTCSIVENMAASSAIRIRLLRNSTRVGYAANFERAIVASEGDIVFLCDQDDFWMEGKVERMLRAFDDDLGVQVVIHDQALCDESLQVVDESQLAKQRASGVPDVRFVTGCCTAFRASWRELILPFPVDHEGHDSWINRLAYFLGTRSILDERLQCNRRHGANASNWSFSKPGNVPGWKTVHTYGRRDARDGWRKEAFRLSEERSRIFERREYLRNLIPDTSLEAALREIDTRLRRLNDRLRAVESTAWRRIPKVLRLLKSGGYEYSSGWKSAVKDMLGTLLLRR